MSNAPLMPMATAVWLVENTTLTFKQIAEFCKLHEVEIQGIADGDVAKGIVGYNPIMSGQLTREEIELSSKDENRPLKINSSDIEISNSEKKIKKYVPLSKRQDKPDSALWLLKNHNLLKDSQIAKLVGITKNSVTSIRNKSYWNYNSLNAKDPVAMGLFSQKDLLQALEKAYHISTAKKFLNKGVSFADIEKVKFRGNISIEKGAFIDENVIFEGAVSIGTNAKIGPGCIISNSKIGKNAELLAYSFVEESMLESNAKAGPFAHVGVQTKMEEGAEIGNFVETKRSNIGANSKAKHLAYIGDGRIGKGVNIGAGTIFCNYDGVKKHITKIEDDAFIGSNSALVAPLTIGTKSYIGSGSVVTKNVGKGQLAIGRGRQKNMPNRKK